MPRKHETLYKLTDKDGYTMRGEPGETLWTPGKPVSIKFSGKLCHEGCLHAYRSPLIAVFCDPRNGSYLPSGKLWEARGVVKLDNGLKVGCEQITTINEIDVPALSTATRIRTAMKMTLQAIINTGYTTLTERDGWARWVEAWLDGRDRTRTAANRATDKADPETDAMYSAGEETRATWAERRHTAENGWSPEDVADESAELALVESRNAVAMAVLWASEAAMLATYKRKSAPDEAAYVAAGAAAWAIEAVRLKAQADLAAGYVRQPQRINVHKIIEQAVATEEKHHA